MPRCNQYVGPVGLVTGCGQWVVDLFDYLIMNYPTPLVSVLFSSVIHTFCSIFNPRRACARVTSTSRNQAHKQQYQRLQRDTGMKYKKGFFFKTLRSEVMASFTHRVAPASFQGS